MPSVRPGLGFARFVYRVAMVTGLVCSNARPVNDMIKLLKIQQFQL